MEKLGGPLVIVAAVWGLFTSLLKAIEILNERRDTVLAADSKLTVGHRRLILYSDWLAIYVSCYAFIGFVGLIVFATRTPQSATGQAAGATGEWVAARVPEVTGAALIAMSVIGLVTGWTDFSAMRRHIASLSPSQTAES